MLTGEMNGCALNRYVITLSILKASKCVVICRPITYTYTALSADASSIVDCVPSCILKWTGYIP